MINEFDIIKKIGFWYYKVLIWELKVSNEIIGRFSLLLNYRFMINGVWKEFSNCRKVMESFNWFGLKVWMWDCVCRELYFIIGIILV